MIQKQPLVDLERPLSQLEKVFWRMSKGASLNFTVTVRLRGPLDDARLAAALRNVEYRHPYLQVRIEASPAGPAFRGDHVGPIPLETHVVPSGEWVPFAEREINTQIDWAAGPLVRCTCLHHDDGSHHLLLTFHHAIGDGISGVTLVRDVLEQLGGESSVTPLTDNVPMDKRLPAYAVGFSGLRRRVGMSLRFLAEDLWFRPAARVRADEQVPISARTVRILSREFDAEFTDRLLARARREQTTLHGALSAAMCLGVAHDLAGTRRISVKHQSPINCRDGLAPPVGEDLGMFASMLYYRGRVSSRDDFWELARNIRSQIVAARQRNKHIAIVRLMTFFYRVMRCDRMSDDEFLQFWWKLTPSTSSLTNVGRVPLAATYGRLAVEAIHFVVSPSALGDFSSNSATVNGRLSWNFLCPEPTLSREHAASLVEDIVERLQNAA